MPLIPEPFYKNRPVLVTGGAGFIGSHLCDRLVALGAQVRILDNLQTGSINNIAQHRSVIDFQRGSIENFTACMKAAAGVSTIFHLAAEVSVAHGQKMPHKTLQANVQGTQHLLEAARLTSKPRLIFASSAAVYGDHEGRCSEELTPRPISTYGYSKLIGEKLCQLYAHCYEIETVSLRFFNVYGERQNPHGGSGGVLSVFEQKIKANQPIALFGDGLQTRDFVPVSEVVDALIAAGMLNGQYADGQPFNIATGKSVTLKSMLMEMCKRYPDYRMPLQELPARAGDIRHSEGDCSKFQKAVSY